MCHLGRARAQFAKIHLGLGASALGLGTSTLGRAWIRALHGERERGADARLIICFTVRRLPVPRPFILGSVAHVDGLCTA